MLGLGLFSRKAEVCKWLLPLMVKDLPWPCVLVSVESGMAALSSLCPLSCPGAFWAPPFYILSIVSSLISLFKLFADFDLGERNCYQQALKRGITSMEFAVISREYIPLPEPPGCWQGPLKSVLSG